MKKIITNYIYIGFSVLFMSSTYAYTISEEKLKIIKQKAELGNADYQDFLGLIYERKGNKKKALYWYSLAVKQGNIKAYQSLAQLYLQEGKLKRGLEILKAKQELSIDIKFLLGEIYCYGLYNVNIDKAKAENIFRELVHKKSHKSEYILGGILEKQKQYKESYIYYKKAADANYVPAAYKVLSFNKKYDFVNLGKAELLKYKQIRSKYENFNNITTKNNLLVDKNTIVLKGSQKIFGISLTESNNGFKIVQVFKNSPAGKADIRAGSILLKVDNQTISDWNMKQVLTFLNKKNKRLLTLKLKNGENKQVPLVKSDYTVQDGIKEMKF